MFAGNLRSLWIERVNDFILEVKHISKRYPGRSKKANDDISFFLRKGEILCVAGENGAGKTTLMKILMGLERPDAGEIFINGKKETVSSPAMAKNLKMGMARQHFTIFPEYTVAENIVMGMEPRKFLFFFDTRKANEIASKIIKKHGFAIDAGQKIKDLSYGQAQQAEICRILYRGGQIIILDEPTSILTEQEASSLFITLKELKLQGRSIILITHKPREIMGNCDRALVLGGGKVIGIRETSVTEEGEISRMIRAGNTQAENSVRIFDANRVLASSNGARPVIEFKDVTVTRGKREIPLLDKVSFKVYPSEILGVTGVGGNGLGVVEAVLGGFLHPASGKVLHAGKDISAFNTRALRANGLAYVPSDRIRVGSSLDGTIAENIIINRRRDFYKTRETKKNVKYFTESIINAYRIEGAQASEKCKNLSGGNLQKLILAREIEYHKDYIIFSEPTWGLDIGSSVFIMKEIENIRKKGAAVILISTNLDEILNLADRIIVMYKGRALNEYENNGDKYLKKKIENCMAGFLE